MAVLIVLSVSACGIMIGTRMKFVIATPLSARPYPMLVTASARPTAPSSTRVQSPWLEIQVILRRLPWGVFDTTRRDTEHNIAPASATTTCQCDLETMQPMLSYCHFRRRTGHPSSQVFSEATLTISLHLDPSKSNAFHWWRML